MSLSVSALTLDGVDNLPMHSRRCLFWEVEPNVANGQNVSDPVFEKEAWLSMVMLEWGSCGQLAMSDGRPAGCAIYSPPGSVPRANHFPTSPVSSDAVLLTTLRLEGVGGTGAALHGNDADELSRLLVQAVIADLVRRGVRALEAFGNRSDGVAIETAPDGPLATASRECSPETCMIGADFLEEVGFEVVAPHHLYPRLRLELDTDHGWKADVEHALDQLLAAAALTEERVMVGSC
ncbi:GNAT family N-acetyltransferase [Aldersonia sp. NBC_00410]|uniref:GNAT family N-acetyltransferase n=1 Tax=Aldersonia sp. NBC_00410 TaxID=2975954 RepID=UPI00225265AD|nr:GNAT family N-acetyltransferase [Aldersonia sp. NBC_00410]MCX5045005.1 GNAT family N-acetyltransferase [Aldersonia sp. NBC_00410]